MGLAPIPAGGILFRDKQALETISKKVPYLAGGEAEQATLTGTRPGASAIAVWALLKHLGEEGYKAIVKQCMRLTWELVKEISKISGLKLVIKPVINIVGIRSDIADIRFIAQKLREKGWAVSLFDEWIRVIIMPHVKAFHIKSFLKDLTEVMKEFIH
jgi:tyrosine decarboxylase/aspartate 1-decarboxylase